jgi:site-specific DNA-methyltransferase (adenine-specific)
METHAYAFIHTNNIKTRMAELFGDGMQFDVIIGNPPYQLGSDGGTRDVPIYQHFVEQAKRLEPRLLSMVIPSRWMAAGLGLSEFRAEMLGDKRIRELVDYPAASDVFPGVEVKAGVCYFLWDGAHSGECTVTTIRGNEVVGPVKRNLGEYDVFVRDSRAMSILRKVLSHAEPSINSILARDKEFGWTSNFDGFHEDKQEDDLPLHYIRTMKRCVGYIAREAVSKSTHLIDKWKVLVPQAFNGGDSLPHQILGKPLIAESPSVCTQSFLFFSVSNKEEAISLKSYYTTRLFRFLVSLRKITQHATHATYAWVPAQIWDRNWTDGALYEKYDINKDEQAFIESQVREMILEGNTNE